MKSWRQILGYKTEPADEWVGWLVNREDRYAVILALRGISSNTFWGYFGDSEEEAISKYNYLKSHPEARRGIALPHGSLTWAYLNSVEKIRFIESISFEVNLNG